MWTGSSIEQPGWPRAASRLFGLAPRNQTPVPKCGFKLANGGHDTRGLQHRLGHKNISNTTIYTAMASDRFKDFWR